MIANNIRQLAKEKKERAIRYPFSENAVYGLISRIFGEEYRKRFVVKEAKSKEGREYYRLSDTQDGKILVEATTGVAAAAGLRYYLAAYCHSYIGPLTRRLSLPEVPPQIGTTVENETPFLYRYFFNYCTFGYTTAFFDASEWEHFLDWLLLSGYNLILNPLGNELVFQNTLLRLGYTVEEARAFLSAPVFYPWQSMLNISGYGGAAPEHFYEDRLKLSQMITERLNAFGAEVVLPGYSGIIPDDFVSHFPNARILKQGGWCNAHRPSLVHYEDPLFQAIATAYYEEQKKLLGDGHAYFSVDPFHEGGKSDGVDMAKYATACFSAMQNAEKEAVWFLQGWTTNPNRALLSALPADSVLIANLKSEVNVDGGDNFASRPWMYGCVNNFGGRRVPRANLESQYAGPHRALSDPDYSMVGIAYLPEGVEVDEVSFDIFSEISFRKEPLPIDAFFERYMETRYGTSSPALSEAWSLLRKSIYLSDTSQTPKESPFITRPTLSARMVTPASATDIFTYHPEELLPILSLFLSETDRLLENEAFRFDLSELLRQLVALTGWGVLREMEAAFEGKDMPAFDAAAADFMRLAAYLPKVMADSPAKNLQTQLSEAARYGKTAEEKQYFARILKTLYTSWGDAASSEILHDYAAREESGMLEAFYLPRWEAYIAYLREHKDTPLATIHVEYPYYEIELRFCENTVEIPETKKENFAYAEALCKDCASLLSRQSITVTRKKQKNAMELS